MATVYSDQRTNDLASPPVPNSPNTAGKAVRRYFAINTTVQPLNIGDVAELCKIPVNARVVGGAITFEAMGTGATASIGIAGATAKYLSAGAVAAIGNLSIANTIALNFGEVTASEETIILTAAGANYAAAKKLRGYIEYISAGE